MRQQNYGATIKSIISRKSIYIMAFAFVDDVDIIQTEFNEDSMYKGNSSDLINKIIEWDNATPTTL